MKRESFYKNNSCTSIITPIQRTKYPKRGFSFSLEIYVVSMIPIAIPKLLAIVKLLSKDQSIAMCVCMSPENPMRDFAAMITSDVPTASFMGIPARITRAGIIRKPPPAPTSPVKIPTRAPSRIVKSIVLYGEIVSCDGDVLYGRIIENAASTMIIAKRIRMNESLLIVKYPREIIFGRCGMIQRRVTYTEMMDGIPKSIAVLICTFPFRYCWILPIRAVTPTIKSEYAVAVEVGICRTYTSIGTVSMDPPLPIRPREIPTKRARVRAILCMCIRTRV